MNKKAMNTITKWNEKITNKKIDITILRYLGDNIYEINCKNHGNINVDGNRISRRLNKSYTPCPICYPYNKVGKLYSSYGKYLDKQGLKLIDYIGGIKYKFYCYKHKEEIIIDSSLIQDRIRNNITICPTCNPKDNNLNKAKQKYGTKLFKFGIELCSYDGNGEYTLNCKKHGKGKVNGLKAFGRLQKNRTPCPICLPYSKIDKINQSYGDIFYEQGLKAIEYLGNKCYKFYCYKHKGNIKINGSSIKDRVKYNNIICPTCNPKNNFLNDAKNKYGEKLKYYSMDLIKYLGNGKYILNCNIHGQQDVFGEKTFGRLQNFINPCPKCLPYEVSERNIINYKDILKKYDITDIKHKEKNIYKIYCNKCNNYSSITINLMKQRIDSGISPCFKCIPYRKQRSMKEERLLDFIKDIYPNKILSSDRKVLGNGQEIDIYLPENKTGIEFNGIYRHSDKINKIDKDFHRNKSDKAYKKNIMLYHIFEDELKKSMYFFTNILPLKDGLDIEKINSKYELNLYQPKKIGARDTKINSLDTKIAKEFLSEYHIHGKDNANIYIGAYYKQNLIALMSFKQSDKSKNIEYKQGQRELSRYCIAGGVKVVGLFSKLLNYFIKSQGKENIKSIYTYSDLRISDKNDNVYKRNNFDLVHYTDIDYYYVYNGQRYHRYRFRKNKLYELCIDNNIDVKDYNKESEDSLYYKAINDGVNISRIYGCGNIKRELKI